METPLIIRVKHTILRGGQWHSFCALSLINFSLTAQVGMLLTSLIDWITLK